MYPGKKQQLAYAGKMFYVGVRTINWLCKHNLLIEK